MSDKPIKMVPVGAVVAVDINGEVINVEVVPSPGCNNCLFFGNLELKQDDKTIAINGEVIKAAGEWGFPCYKAVCTGGERNEKIGIQYVQTDKPLYYPPDDNQEDDEDAGDVEYVIDDHPIGKVLRIEVNGKPEWVMVAESPVTSDCSPCVFSNRGPWIKGPITVSRGDVKVDLEWESQTHCESMCCDETERSDQQDVHFILTD